MLDRDPKPQPRRAILYERVLGLSLTFTAHVYTLR